MVMLEVTRPSNDAVAPAAELTLKSEVITYSATHETTGDEKLLATY